MFAVRVTSCYQFTFTATVSQEVHWAVKLSLAVYKGFLKRHLYDIWKDSAYSWYLRVKCKTTK